MKLLLRTCIIFLVSMMTSAKADAATYTAIADGDYTWPSIWAGGVAPPSGAFHNDTLVIPSGINIYCTAPINFTGTGIVLTINGLLTYPYTLDLNNCKVYGRGTIGDIDSLIGISAFNYGFTGTAGAFKIVGDTITTNVKLYVRSKLYLWEGMTMSAGELSINGVDIYVGGSYGAVPKPASISTSGNAKVYSAKTNRLYYLFGNAIAGKEWHPLSKVYIQTEDTCEIIMNNDILSTVSIEIYSGSLNLNGFKLNIDSTLETRTGFLKSTPSSQLNIQFQAYPFIRFSSGYDTIGVLSFKKRLSNTTAFLLKSNLYIAEKYENIEHQLIIDTNCALVLLQGAKMTANKSVIRTLRGAYIGATLAADSSFLFPLVTDVHYLPCAIVANHTTGYREYRVNLMDDAYRYGLTGPQLTTVLMSTWTVKESGGSPDYDMQIQWPIALERPGFTNSACYLSNFNTATGWDKGLLSPATYISSGVLAFWRNSITTTGSFVLFDKDSFTSVDNPATDKTNLHPNPATDILYVDANQPAHAIVYNISGQVMMTSNIDRNNNSINTSALPQGLYYLQLRNDGVQEMLKFIKQ
jgi:hypothetical protein